MTFEKSKFLQSLLGAAVLLTAGCGARDPHFAILPKSQGYLLNAVTSNKVDILWLIDNSGTMGPKQTNLANSINSFMDKFSSKNMDYRIAVVTTDIRPVDPAAPADPNVSGQGACFVGSPSIITPSTPNAAAALATNANVGFFGSSDAHGLNAVSLALSEPNLSECNSGFLRADAFLAVIEFSDADDNTSATVNGLLNYLDQVKPPISTANGGSVRSYFVSSMVVDDLSKAECQALGPFSELGTKFLNIANATGGTIASICDADFSQGLLAVSNKILESSTAIQLASVPDQSTIIVYQNGSQISKSSSNGWTFESSTNRIIFHGSGIPTNAGIYVQIDYTPADIVR